MRWGTNISHNWANEIKKPIANNQPAQNGPKWKAASFLTENKNM